MNTLLNGATKRLIFALVVASSLGGCAVYQPVATRAPVSWDDEGEWYTVDEMPQPMFVAPTYINPWFGVPYYVGPSISFGLGVYSGHRGHRWHHGFRDGRHGGHGRR